MARIYTSFVNQITPLMPILSSLVTHGSTPYLVGGSVRDLVMQIPLKDFDIEVHNITSEQLEQLLSTHGEVKSVGKKFGVFRLLHLDVDWSLPRKDNAGRKPDVTIDPSMTIADACRRRDVTINAMAIDLTPLALSQSKLNQLLDGSMQLDIIDPYGGLDDIAHKRLRAVDDILFVQDPLRFFRVMQFIGRFAFTPTPELDALCAGMSLHDQVLDAPLAQERIHQEIKKLFLLSAQPSLGLRWIQRIGRLAGTFPELAATIDTPQRPDYHPEGNVFEHTMQALDATAGYNFYIDTQQWTTQEEKFVIMLAALCHDLGKVSTTDVNLHAHGHDIAGVEPAKKLLKRITHNQTIVAAVIKLVRHHLAPLQLLSQNSSDKAYKKLALKLWPDATLRQLAILALADAQGRNPDSMKPLDQFYDTYQAGLARADKALVLHAPEPALLQGRDLLDHFPTGPLLGKAVKLAYQLQIEQAISDKDLLKSLLLQRLK